LPPARASSPPPRAIAITVCAVAILAVLGIVIAVVDGCGASHTTGTAADPARAVPASAPLYAGAEVRPKDGKEKAALASGRALTHQANPYLRLLTALQTPGSPAPDFKRDVAPWLGPRAGIFLSSMRSSRALLDLLQRGLLGQSPSTGAFPFGANGSQGAIVLDTRDTAKARAFLRAAAGRAGAHGTSYRGISYEASAGDVAFGVVNRFAVIGSEAGMRSVIDTVLGGPSLARAPGYARLLAYAPAKSLAHLYSNAGRPTAGGPASGLAGLLALVAQGRQMNVSFVPSASSLALDVDTLTAGSAPIAVGLPAFSTEASQALGELPGESWFALGLGDAGHMLAADVQGLKGLGSLAGSGSSGAGATAGLSLNSLVEGLTLPLNVLGANTAEARRSFQSWMGSAGIFASGTGLLELKGAVVINSSNPALSRAAVGKLAARLRTMGASVQASSLPGTDAAATARLSGLPVALVIADGRGAGGQSKFVIGLGEASVAAALRPSGTLASSPTASAAAAALGEGTQPSIVVDVPTLLSLLEGIGLTEDPTISGVVPYLRSITSVAGGAHRLDTAVERFKLVAGLRPAG
jgi:Protein of unknown function (DUF3352)